MKGVGMTDEGIPLYTCIAFTVGSILGMIRDGSSEVFLMHKEAVLS